MSLRLAGGFGLAALSLFMLIGYLGSDLAPGSAASLAALGLVVGLPAVAAFVLLHGHYADRNRLASGKATLREQVVESEILRLAAAKGGKLTAVEVATHLVLAPEAATDALDRLALRGQAAYEVTDAGLIVYSFYDIIHLDGKSSAKGILDD